MPGMESNRSVKAILIGLASAALILLGLVRSDLGAVTTGDAECTQSSKVFNYLCEDGKSFTLTLLPDEDSVLLTLEGKPMKLPRVVSASGDRYSNGRTSVWLKGNEAFIEIDGKIIIKNCRRRD
ncbi:MliC family protein [Desulfobacca acetoxidans]|uniref:C-type lysozyme inhibitor domain-containing protein n=1 Tax=Desulfobacca acetoxidans (strain ATCC 700848 / DSM 11109 / ASRB2) TaxID=880072 RepID=F2NHF9_DESAR|nr:MliC family protein [Desulfobacca acetoxidans]AEB09075.1 Protein of unknown function DUF2091, periplasmic [Desulfobacca acetoxidans DSM 11109]HAY21348.1 hypothetical protein [Desulfobacterales bacterium]